MHVVLFLYPCVFGGTDKMAHSGEGWENECRGGEDFFVNCCILEKAGGKGGENMKIRKRMNTWSK